ncbi:MAG: ubiquinol-cytochrome c reductase iron-sulfur subunit, partial [Sphingobium sp.]
MAIVEHTDSTGLSGDDGVRRRDFINIA